MTAQMNDQTVVGATNLRALATPEARALYDLIECVLNAEATLQMMGCKRVKPTRRGTFLPVGAMTLNQIEVVLARTPIETALVKASMAFPCDFCGRPAETGTDDGWICESCFAVAAAAESRDSPGTAVSDAPKA